MNLARQELPGIREIASIAGRLIPAERASFLISPSVQPSCWDSTWIALLTRQFLPGYIHSLRDIDVYQCEGVAPSDGIHVLG